MNPFLAVVALVLGIYLLGFWAPRRWRKARTTQREQAKLIDQRERERRTRESVEALEVRLHDFAREIVSTLDTKTALLKEHLAHAEALVEKLEAAANPPPPPMAERESRPKRFDESHADILQLHGEGLGVDDIAAKTGRPAGEILLILGLKQGRKEPLSSPEG